MSEFTPYTDEGLQEQIGSITEAAVYITPEQRIVYEGETATTVITIIDREALGQSHSTYEIPAAFDAILWIRINMYEPQQTIESCIFITHPERRILEEYFIHSPTISSEVLTTTEFMVYTSLRQKIFDSIHIQDPSKITLPMAETTKSGKLFINYWKHLTWRPTHAGEKVVIGFDDPVQMQIAKRLVEQEGAMLYSELFLISPNLNFRAFQEHIWEMNRALELFGVPLEIRAVHRMGYVIVDKAFPDSIKATNCVLLQRFERRVITALQRGHLRERDLQIVPVVRAGQKPMPFVPHLGKFWFVNITLREYEPIPTAIYYPNSGSPRVIVFGSDHQLEMLSTIAANNGFLPYRAFPSVFSHRQAVEAVGAEVKRMNTRLSPLGLIISATQGTGIGLVTSEQLEKDTYVVHKGIAVQTADTLEAEEIQLHRIGEYRIGVFHEPVPGFADVRYVAFQDRTTGVLLVVYLSESQLDFVQTLIDGGGYRSWQFYGKVNRSTLQGKQEKINRSAQRQLGYKLKLVGGVRTGVALFGDRTLKH